MKHNITYMQNVFLEKALAKRERASRAFGLLFAFVLGMCAATILIA